jgi:hypothetical protein
LASFLFFDGHWGGRSDGAEISADPQAEFFFILSENVKGYNLDFTETG